MSKHACVTGADHGVGLALAKQLAEDGYTVFAGRYSRDNQELLRLADQLKGKVLPVELDISSDWSVANAASWIGERTEKLDVLINNGAILGTIDTSIEDELDFAEMQRVFNVNTLGPLRMAHALLPLVMNSSQKLIVNISSEAGSITDCERDSWFAYCMSKSALNMQSALIHNRLKSEGGQVLVLHPGWVQSYMRGHLDEAAELTPAQAAQAIVDKVHNHSKYVEQRPAYLDDKGQRMRW